MPQIREATAADIDMLARLHVAAWRESYPGLLPEAEIAARTEDVRRAQWTRAFSTGRSRIWVAPDLGFAQAGSQRDDDMRQRGYPQELYALYVLRAGHGTGIGAALFNAVRSPRPMTALVIDGNARACRFYEKQGGRLILTRMDAVGESPTRERAYGWPALPD